MRKVQVIALKGEIKHDSARDAEKVTVTECREQTESTEVDRSVRECLMEEVRYNLCQQMNRV